MSGLAEAFVIDATTKRKIVKSNEKAFEIIKPFLNGKNIRRYNISYEKKIFYTPTMVLT